MADATTATNPKIEELRARLKADPKSRHFYPLAEELRKIHQLEEAEQILRDGIQTHASYLSAWISLGRVLRDRSRDHEAVEVLKRALVLDPGNVVAAKLLAQAYLGIGDKVEAIKKYKLVFALMPSDEEVEAAIQQLDRELNSQNYEPVPSLPSQDAVESPIDVLEAAPGGAAEELPPLAVEQPFAMDQEPSRFDMTDPVPFGVEEEPFGSTADSALSSFAASLSPVATGDEEPLPLGQDIPANVAEAANAMEQEAEPFGEISEAVTAVAGEDEGEREDDEGTQPFGESSAPPSQIPATMTMAQLYESQGHEDQAAEVYRQILEQQPDHEQARFALARAEAPAGGEGAARNGRREVIRRLEQWRERMARS